MIGNISDCGLDKDYMECTSLGESHDEEEVRRKKKPVEMIAAKYDAKAAQEVENSSYCASCGKNEDTRYSVDLSNANEETIEEEEEEVLFQLDVSKASATEDPVTQLPLDKTVDNATSSSTCGSSNSFTSKKPCIFWSKPGGCKNGSKCPFLHSAAHTLPKREPAITSHYKQQQLDNKVQEVCVHFARGRCRAGNLCRFLHGELPEPLLSRSSSGIQQSHLSRGAEGGKDGELIKTSSLTFVDSALEVGNSNKKRKLSADNSANSIDETTTDSASVLEKYSMTAFLNAKDL